MEKRVRVRFSKGVFEPLEAVELEEGTELSITFDEKYSRPLEERIKRTMSTAGAWKGRIDGEKLKREIYESRRAGSRLEPDP
jgi:predicted DNA-binding antitoxin AbrB/MazE fold protein